MLPSSTAPRPSVRDHGAHFAPDGRQAVTGRVRQTVPHRLADPGSVWRDHAIGDTTTHGAHPVQLSVELGWKRDRDSFALHRRDRAGATDARADRPVLERAF